MALKIQSIREINNLISYNPEKFILDSEAQYRQELRTAAEKILEKSDNHSLVLVSGPSGSGKTTSALRVEGFLKEMGCKASTLSMDNYFLPDDMIDDVPLNEDGEVDLESPYRLDIPLLNKHMEMLNNCEEIECPIFDFKTNSRTGVIPIKREPGEVIIIEGIHALNPVVTGNSRDYATCIYVSVRTRLENSEADRLHPRLIRLMRRISRDKLFRGRALTDTFRMFKSVSRGEEKHIMPHKHLADFDIDTFIPFETSVYRSVIFDDLLEAKEKMHGNFDYDMITQFLGELTPLDKELLADYSLIREFVG